MWLAQFVCTPQFFKTPKGLCGHTVFLYALDTKEWCQDKSVSIATGYEMNDQGSIPSPFHSVQTGYGVHPASFLPNGYWEPYPLGEGLRGRGMKLTAHIHLVLRSGMELYLHSQ
jgi:hypothetical protein